MPLTKHTKTIQQFLDDAEQARTTGNVQKADMIYVQLLKHDKNLIPAKLGRGMLLVHAGRHTDGLAEAVDVLLQDKSNLNAYHLVLLAYNNMGQVVKGEDWCNKGLTLYPNDGYLLSMKARILALKGETAAALDLIERHSHNPQTTSELAAIRSELANQRPAA